jgi:hypothetical protein
MDSGKCNYVSFLHFIEIMSDSDETPNQLSSTLDNEDIALSKYEDELERMINENLTNGQDLYAQKLFISFQNAATNVTKMFRERSNGTNNWNSFHAAAESVTMLYKGISHPWFFFFSNLLLFSESLDALKDTIQLSILNGEQRKTKEILRWTRRKQRRHIRTNELYDYLINRPSDDLVRPIETMNQPPIVDELQTFRQALVINGNTHIFDLDFETILIVI